MRGQIIDEAKKLCEKFVAKVESGRARSKETYAECRALLRTINTYQQAVQADAEPRAVCGICARTLTYCPYCEKHNRTA